MRRNHFRTRHCVVCFTVSFAVLYRRAHIYCCSDSKRTTTIAHAMSSSEVDESCKVLQRNCGPTGRWTIALFLSLVVGNFVFSGFLLWKLSVQEKRFEKTVEKLQLDLQELQVEKEEMKQVYETLSEYGGERGKRSEEHVFWSFIKQMCKPESAICIPGQPGKDGLPGKDGSTGLPGPAGKNGEAGKDGEPGSKGEKGKEGDKGERGYPGFKGQKGGKGEIGLQGGKGMKGDKGTKGNKGDNLPSQCLPGNHRVLSETWRQTSEHVSKTMWHCDKTGSSGNQHGFTPGWHSFSPTIGGAMPEQCTSQYYCGTNASGWLKGSHPNVIGQKISRTVCFRSESNCCRWQTSVEVINCGQYYIYNLPNTPGCTFAYCARGQ